MNGQDAGEVGGRLHGSLHSGSLHNGPPGPGEGGERRTRRSGTQAATRTIVVSLEDRRLALLEDGVVKKVYRVAVGKDATPSPTGTFTIVDRVTNPTYYHAGKVIPPGPGNPVGTRWMGLSEKGYGIHGTNEPRSIGKAASHGCIRMGRRDLQDLFAQVRAGDVVEIVGRARCRDGGHLRHAGRAGDSRLTTVLAKARAAGGNRGCGWPMCLGG